MSTPPLTYARYLKLDALLGLQQPLSAGPEHDELLFITIHQIYELWFQQLLHELLELRARLDRDDAPAAAATLKRVLAILKTLVQQVDVLETMTPLSFNAFRARLETSSGFQSGQFRALEFLLGHKRRSVIAQQADDSPLGEMLERLLAEPSVWDAFVGHLHRTAAPMPDEALRRDPAEPTVADPAVQAALIAIYRTAPIAAQLCERFVDLDEGLQEWRYRHLKMVERTIGARLGTGGSAGMAYLRDTLFRPLFPDLWAIRTQL